MRPEVYGAIRLAEKHEAVALKRRRPRRLKVKHLCKAQKLRYRATRLEQINGTIH